MAESYSFKAPATETIDGTAYFTVRANSVAEARAKLAEDSSRYFSEFKEGTGGTTWEASAPEDFESLDEDDEDEA